MVCAFGKLQNIKVKNAKRLVFFLSSFIQFEFGGLSQSIHRLENEFYIVIAHHNMHINPLLAY